jgi:valyl-tRNA synthetase
MRAELNIPWSAALTPHVLGNPSLVERLGHNATTLTRMGKLEAPVEADTAPPSSAQIVVNGTTIAFPIGDAIDLDAEKARLSKGAEAAEKERDSLAARLGNPNFTERAKPEAVEKARADHEAKAAEAERLRAALERLG